MVQSAAGPARSKAPTIYDVAELAGVSHQTVSRYLNDKAKLRPATLERVEKALAELDYTPNLAARSLRSRELYRIVVVIPEASPYVPGRMLNGAAEAAHAAGFRMDVVAMEGTAEARAERLQGLLAGDGVAGVLSFVPRPAKLGSSPEPVARVPMVVAGEYTNRMRARGSLADGSAAAKIVEHLASLGHRIFFHVAGPSAWPSARNRLAAYEEAIAQLGLTSRGVSVGDWSSSSGYAAGQEIAALDGVTAVFAANDSMAMGVIRALHERGITVPDQVSVFGWDDMPESRVFIPSLSTVHMDVETLGARSMAELVSRIRGEQPAADSPAPAPMELVFRESTSVAPVQVVHTAESTEKTT